MFIRSCFFESVMRLRILFPFLLSLASSFLVNRSSASVVPYYGEGKFPFDQEFKVLQKEDQVDSESVCSKALALYGLASDQSGELRFWAKMTYAYALIENDSLGKVEEILADTGDFQELGISDWLRAYYFFNKGLVAQQQGQYLIADNILRRSISLCSSKNAVLFAQVNGALADNLRYQGKLDQSLVRWYEMLRLSEENGDSSLIADAVLGRGIVRFLQSEIDKASEDIQVFFKYNQSVGNQKNMALGWSLLGLVAYQKGDFQKAIENNMTGYEIRKKIGDIKGQGESLNNLALGYMGLQNWSQALRYLEQAIELKTQANDQTQTTVILNNMGHCHLKLGDDKQALRFFTLALERGRRNGQMADVVNSYKNLIKLHRNNREFETVMVLQDDLLALKDSLNAAERSEAIHELEVKYETEQKEQALELLQKESTIINNRWLNLALGLFFTIILGILIYDNQKRKHRQETQLLVAKDDLQKAELKNMSDQLEYNQKKLQLYTENLIKKNELVGQLESKLKESVESTISEPEEGQRIIEDLSSVRILTEDDWDEFKTLFNGVHRGLLDRLTAQFQDLTLADQRIFLLTKLDLSTNQMAKILGVSPDTVKKGRYRLKKKLQLPDDTSLQDFVTSF